MNDIVPERTEIEELPPSAFNDSKNLEAMPSGEKLPLSNEVCLKCGNESDFCLTTEYTSYFIPLCESCAKDLVDKNIIVRCPFFDILNRIARYRYGNVRFVEERFFCDYLYENGFEPTDRKLEGKSIPDVIRTSDEKLFEVKVKPSVKRAIGQALCYGCKFGDCGIVYAKEVKTEVLKKNEEYGNPFNQFEVLFK